MQHAGNKGTGAGGSKTTLHGKQFEEKTMRLTPFITNIVHLKQTQFKKYMKTYYGIDVFRNPDEAFIVRYSNRRTSIKILEKKCQHVDGSVETKLWSGPSLKREYQLVLEKSLDVEYAFCVNDFLKQKLTSPHKKYTTLMAILGENNISVMFGDDANYPLMLNQWVTRL